MTAICCLSFCSSKVKTEKIVTEKIVIINSGVKDKAKSLAKKIAIIDSLNPRVLALDFAIYATNDPYGDSLLIATLSRCKNLVMGVGIVNYTGRDTVYSEVLGTEPEFWTKNAKIGYTNVKVENDQFGTAKKISIYENVSGFRMYNLAVRTAMSYDSLKTMAYIKDKPRIIDIEYRGGDSNFRTIPYEDVFKKRLTRKDIEGKIVFIGYLEAFKGYKERHDKDVSLKGYKGHYDEDVSFTPLNNKIPPYKPDMHGVVVLANIVAQVLGEK